MDIRDPIEGSRRSIPRHRSLARNSRKTHAWAKTRAAGGASASRGLGCARGRSPVSARSVPPVRLSAGLPRLAPIFSDTIQRGDTCELFSDQQAVRIEPEIAFVLSKGLLLSLNMPRLNEETAILSIKTPWLFKIFEIFIIFFKYSTYITDIG